MKFVIHREAEAWVENLWDANDDLLYICGSCRCWKTSFNRICCFLTKLFCNTPVTDSLLHFIWSYDIAIQLPLPLKVLITYRIMFTSVETYNFEFTIENFWTVTAELKSALSLHVPAWLKSWRMRSCYSFTFHWGKLQEVHKGTFGNFQVRHELFKGVHEHKCDDVYELLRSWGMRGLTQWTMTKAE